LDVFTCLDDRKRVEAEDSKVPDNELIELVLRDVGLEFIPKRAIRVQSILRGRD
jgi:hypothetical protein